LMVESEAAELSEEVMLGAVMHGHQAIQPVLDLINDFAQAVGKTPLSWQPASRDEALQETVKSMAMQDIEAAYAETDKQKRYEQLDTMATKVFTQIEQQDAQSFDADAVNSILEDLKKHYVRQRILDGHKRIDGRDTETVRPIVVESKVLHRTHGSALFTRGETQSLSVVALGNERDAQIIDGLDDAETRQRFMLHYNFPPYSVGEVGFMSSPKRREIGHGKLAWRALKAVMPGQDSFPYVVRVVAETTESNGSSSMAAVCSSSMSLMDAGVPIKSAVAGVAMGLIKSDDRFSVLTDILGDEDHLGDMDFKVAGSRSGITALQMDIKITGITREIMQQALQQAQAARFHILDIMQETLSEPRQQLSDHAPRIIHFSIHPDKIRDVIGKGGVTIRGITEETGASIDISDEGVVTICAPDLAVAEQTQKRIEDIVADVEEGAIYTGKVMKIVDFGAFVNILPGKDGLVHVSQIANERVENVSDHLQEGQEVRVKVIEVDRTGRIRLSMKALLGEDDQ
jgi:polyribonucleotide nucleotidyltransferase